MSRIVAAGTVYTPLLSMRQLEEELPEALFCRVHRSYIVAIGHITSFDHGRVFLGTTEIPLSDHYRKLLPGRLHILFSDVRPSPAACRPLPAVH